MLQLDNIFVKKTTKMQKIGDNKRNLKISFTIQLEAARRNEYISRAPTATETHFGHRSRAKRHDSKTFSRQRRALAESAASALAFSVSTGYQHVCHVNGCGGCMRFSLAARDARPSLSISHSECAI